MMKKKRVRVFGKENYLLGKDEYETKYYLQEASWDCGWYWGGGYVETFTNNNKPELSRDISSHSHFDVMFFKNGNGYDNFKKLFVETPFTDNEIWIICELMRSFYIAREYSDMLYNGGSHYTTNPIKEVIQNKEEYNRINETVIPQIMNELYKILGGVTE